MRDPAAVKVMEGVGLHPSPIVQRHVPSSPRTRTLSLLGSAVMAGALLIGELGEPLLERGFVVDVPAADEALDVDLPVGEEVNFPVVARTADDHTEGVLSVGGHFV